MKSRFAIIAMIALSAVAISTFANLRATRASARNHSAVINAQQTAPEVQSDSLPSALLPDRTKLRIPHVLLVTLPNFARPIRRASLRRKGRIQH